MPTTLPRAIAFLVGFWLALQIVAPLVHAPAASGDAGGVLDPALVAMERRLHEGVNATRERHHLIPLRRLPELDRVARLHSMDMAARGYFSHDTPEGLNPLQRIQRAGVEGFTLAGENVGLTSRSGVVPQDEILQGWMHSPVHRDNLLAPVFNATGIGIARGPQGALYFTQVYVTFPRD